MKEIKIHSKDHGNLLSIAELRDGYEGEKYLASTIQELSILTGGYVYADLSRPNYDVSAQIAHLRNALSGHDVTVAKEYFEVTFVYSLSQSNDDLFAIMAKLWFAFEHVSYIFSADKSRISDIRRKSWYEVTSRLTSYMMFKGAEDSVLWIAKSDNLKFNLDGLSE